MISGDGRTINYNAFNKPTSIKKNGITSEFSYGANHMRYKQVKKGLPTGTEITHYIDKTYEVIERSGVTKLKAYVGDAIITQTVGGNNAGYDIGFVHRDRLGSVVTITDENGNVIDNKSYDPFGKPRKGTFEVSSSPTLKDISSQSGYIAASDDILLTTRRGFTDHEHLDDAQLIHMNGRVYDYNLGRFLSVDPFIQEPGNSQSMNPYSYIMNNPLAGTDPSGYKSQFKGCAASRIEKVCNNTSSWSGGNSGSKNLGQGPADNGNEKQQKEVVAPQSKEVTDIGDSKSISKKGESSAVTGAGRSEGKPSANGNHAYENSIGGFFDFVVDNLTWEVWGDAIQQTKDIGGPVETLVDFSGIEDATESVKNFQAGNVRGGLQSSGGVLLGKLKAAQKLVTKRLPDVKGLVTSRVNLEGNGWTHLMNRHYEGGAGSPFTIDPNDLRSLLQSDTVVKSPITQVLTDKNGFSRYVREVDVGKNIGMDKLNNYSRTSKMTVITDKKGNLLTAHPGTQSY
ncbi:RHS repeat domain-containing protein [Aliikangiella sp. IMCC44632]